MDGSNIKTDYPVVLRFEGLYPHHLAGYEAHRLRKGGDLSHVNRERSKLNHRLIGPEDWAAQALAEIREMAAENFAAEVASLEKRNRKKDIERRFVEGPKQPWRATRHGPMREVILTVNKDWFASAASGEGRDSENSHETRFGEYATWWLIENFGEDVIHARADRDEAAFNVHAVIMPRATVEIAKPNAKMPTATAARRMLQPSIHPLIKDYEAAQDSVGQWFADLGLVRGERRAKKIRDARETGQTPPKRRYHAKTWKWRAEQELQLKDRAEALETDKAALDERTARVAERENEAETVLAVAEGVASGAFVASEGEDEPGLVEAPTAKPAETPLEDLQRRSATGFARAAGVFGRAWGRLFVQARAKAEAEAEARVASAMDQIERVDEIVAEAALHLPFRTRSLVGEIRQTIPAILRKLRSSRVGPSGGPQKGQAQRDDPGDEEKF